MIAGLQGFLTRLLRNVRPPPLDSLGRFEDSVFTFIESRFGKNFLSSESESSITIVSGAFVISDLFMLDCDAETLAVLDGFSPAAEVITRGTDMGLLFVMGLPELEDAGAMP